MDPKPRPHHAIYLHVLRSLTPEQRLAKAFELGAMGRELMRAGLKARNPNATPDRLRALEREVLSRCHNRNY